MGPRAEGALVVANRTSGGGPAGHHHAAVRALNVDCIHRGRDIARLRGGQETGGSVTGGAGRALCRSWGERPSQGPLRATRVLGRPRRSAATRSSHGGLFAPASAGRRRGRPGPAGSEPEASETVQEVARTRAPGSAPRRPVSRRAVFTCGAARRGREAAWPSPGDGRRRRWRPGPSRTPFLTPERAAQGGRPRVHGRAPRARAAVVKLEVKQAGDRAEAPIEAERAKVESGGGGNARGRRPAGVHRRADRARRRGRRPRSCPPPRSPARGEVEGGMARAQRPAEQPAAEKERRPSP